MSATPERDLTGHVPTMPPVEATDAAAFTYPLSDFYALAGLELPSIEPVDGADVPVPYKSLLVHRNDMTPTLETFHRCTIHIRALSRKEKEGFYFREVLLLLDGSDRPVEFGAIKIDLGLFEPEPRRLILEERLPLGRILAEHSVEHTSRPTAFLKITADRFIAEALHVAEGAVLYGRRNTLLDPENRPLAEIVEILPETGRNP